MADPATLLSLAGGALGGLFGGRGGRQTTTQTSRVDIPSFLQGNIFNSQGIADESLLRLNHALHNAGASDLVAPFNPTQLAGQQGAMDFLRGPGMQRAQNAMGNIAGGQFINNNIGSFLDGIQGVMNSHLPSASVDALSGAASTSGIPATAANALNAAASTPFQLNPFAQSALQQSAGGNFLAGNPGFNAAVDASIRAAQPAIASTFGRAGRARGGLAQVAMQQAASDAFAREFGNERNRQLSAANQLGNFGLQGRQQQIGAAGQLGTLGLGDRGQQIGAATNLGNLNLAQQQQRLQATGLLGNVLNSERGRQFSAAQALPQMGLLGPEVMMNIGGMQQDQSQRELTAPLQAQQTLLGLAQSGLPIQSLLGQTTTGTMQMPSNRMGNILGGASLGFGIGQQMFPGSGGFSLMGGGDMLGINPNLMGSTGNQWSMFG